MNITDTPPTSKTNGEKVQSKNDEGIDFSDSPKLTAEFMASAWRENATLTLEVEPEVLAWFRAQGDAADAKMRAALRSYAQAHQQ